MPMPTPPPATPTPRLFDPRYHHVAPALPTPAPGPVESTARSAYAGAVAQAVQPGIAARWEHLLRRSALSPEARRVGMALTGYANAAGALGTATPGLRRLTNALHAQGFGMHSLTVRGALHELQAGGWIYRDPDLTGPFGRQVYAITLLIPAHLQEPTS